MITIKLELKPEFESYEIATCADIAAAHDLRFEMKSKYRLYAGHQINTYDGDILINSITI